MVHIPTIDWNSCPIESGSPSRVPSDGWANWFSYSPDDVPDIVRIGEEDYLEQWRELGESRLSEIREASRRAGLEDVNALLNNAVGETVARAVAKLEDFHIKILDIGAGNGNTSLSIYRRLSPKDRPRISFTAIDLSSKMLKGEGGEPSYAHRLKEAGAAVDEIIVGSDIEILPRLRADAYTLVVGVASLHQHGDILAPFREIYRVTAEGGFFITADWHVWSMWKHPALVRQYLLERMEFEGKMKLLEEFIAAYPRANENPPRGTRIQEQSNREIASFWLAYAGLVRKRKGPKSRFLEGHRPAEDYCAAMEYAGFKTQGEEITGSLVTQNPLFLRPESTLNAIVVGFKK